MMGDFSFLALLHWTLASIILSARKNISFVIKVIWRDFLLFNSLKTYVDLSLISKIIHFPDDSVKRKIAQSMIGVSWRAVILLTNIGLLANINWNTWQSPTWKLYNLCYETVSHYITTTLTCTSGVKQKLYHFISKLSFFSNNTQ